MSLLHPLYTVNVSLYFNNSSRSFFTCPVVKLTQRHSTCRYRSFLDQSLSLTWNQCFLMHSTMKRGEPCRASIYRRVFPPTPASSPPRGRGRGWITDNNRSNQRETTREDSKSGRALGTRVSTLAAESNFVECHPRDLDAAAAAATAATATAAMQRSAFERSNRSIAISSKGEWGGGGGGASGSRNGGGCAVRFPRRAPRRSIEPPDRAGYNIFFIWSRGSSLWRVFRAGSGQRQCTG